MMSSAGHFNFMPKSDYNGRFFGMVSERALCRAIDLFTGSVTGVCQDHCLVGCAAGTRCKAGVCQ
jgi:hypothetical protein